VGKRKLCTVPSPGAAPSPPLPSSSGPSSLPSYCPFRPALISHCAPTRALPLQLGTARFLTTALSFWTLISVRLHPGIKDSSSFALPFLPGCWLLSYTTYPLSGHCLTPERRLCFPNAPLSWYCALPHTLSVSWALSCPVALAVTLPIYPMLTDPALSFQGS
jgi:hypothetical protein